MDQKKLFRRNNVNFGIGTIGRDMFYSFGSMQLIFFLTEIMRVSNTVRLWLAGIYMALRIFDAFNDPISGLIVDNTKSRWGKFKPWISIGAITGGAAFILLFTDMKLGDAAFIIVFSVLYLIWDFTYGLNDIAYWSMLPSLTTDKKEREKMGSFARICASIGAFSCIVAVVPVTRLIAKALGGDMALYESGGSDPILERSWFLFAVIVVALMLFFQAFTVFGVKENEAAYKSEEKTTLRDMFRVILKNDQLLILALAMSLFMIGYSTTTSFGLHYFKYVFKNEGMYSVFAAILGVSQLIALALFPAIAKKTTRKKLYGISTILVVAGYLLFYFSPQSMIYVGIAGVLIFVGQAFIQMLMLMFLSDTIEYGQLKLGKRNESITFSVQPFINKIGGAIASGIVFITLNVARINPNEVTVSEVPQSSIAMMKFSMLIFPLIVIAAGYFICRKKFVVDEKMHAEIMQELRARGDIRDEATED